MLLRYAHLCLWLLLSWSTSIGISRAFAPTVPLISSSEVSALNALYLSTNGSYWEWSPRNQGVWNFSQPNPQPCVENWQGVVCGDCAAGLCHVTTLTLDGYNLSGMLPVELVNLTHLSVLDLRRNSVSGALPNLENMTLLSELDLRTNLLTGTLPAWLGRMASLTHINLSVNSFRGGLPDELFNSTKLSIISISSNKLGGTLPNSVGRLSSLTELDVGANSFSGTIVEELGSLPNLQFLRLGINNLGGSIPPALYNATSLVGLYLDNNTLTGSLSPQVMRLTSLSALDLHGNLLEGSIPAEIGNLPNLTYLSLYFNFFTGELPASLDADSRLEHLYLYDNLLTGSLPQSIAQMKRLELLDVHKNAFLTGSLNATFQGMQWMAYLVLGQNFFTGPLAELQCPRLLVFRVEDNFLSGRLPPSLAAPDLSYLNLSSNLVSGSLPATMLQDCPRIYWDNSYNLLSGSIPDTFEKGCTLIQLFLNDNRLTGRLPANLSLLADLAELDLSSNRLSGPVPTSWQALRSLEILFLENNLLSGPLDGLLNATLQPYVTNVDVSHNRFTGTLPLEPFRIASLWSFAASSNCLHGTLPEQICEAAGLVVLVLDGMSTGTVCRRDIFPSLPYLNAFVLRYSLGGTLPACLFSMRTLRSLHLSGNHLTGSLPDSDDYAPALSDINLSHNQVGGSLPLTLQRRALRTLDLSYNRFGGTLDAHFAAGSNETSLALQVNRLSGSIPASLRTAPSISILDGNIFDCSVSRAQLPRHDPQQAIYVCGSDAVNSSLLAWTALWLLALAALAGGIGGYLWWHRQSPFHFYYACYEQWVHTRAALLSLESCATATPEEEEEEEEAGTSSGVGMSSSSSSSSSSSPTPSPTSSGVAVKRVDPRAIEKLMALFRSIRALFLWTGAFIVVVCVPVFVGLTSLSATYTYEYAWELSAVLLGGSTAAVVLVVVFDGVLGVFVYHVVRLWLRHPPRKIAASEAGGHAGSLRETLRVGLLAVVNLAVMIAVDCGYVYIVFHYDSLAVGLTQVAMALFKIFWNEAALWALIPLTKKVFFAWRGGGRDSDERGSRVVDIELSSRGITAAALAEASEASGALEASEASSPSPPVLSDEDFNLVDIRFLTFNTMLNNIVVPAVAIACVSSNCFPNALVAAPEITNTYVIEQCIVFATFGDSIRCFQSTLSRKSVSYRPPFSYSYQCASTIATTYSAVFVFMFIISGVLLPCGKLALRHGLLHHTREGSRFQRWAQTHLPGRFQMPRPDGVGRPLVLFQKGKFAVRTVSYLATLVAFGSIFPPLALVGCLSMAIVTLEEQFILGTFLLRADRARLRWFRDELCRQCTGTLEYLHASVRQVVPFSCAILGYLVFDTLGYTAGFLPALLAALAFALPPLVLFPAAARGVLALAADRRRASRLAGVPLQTAATPADVVLYAVRKWCAGMAGTAASAAAEKEREAEREGEVEREREREEAAGLSSEEPDREGHAVYNPMAANAAALGESHAHSDASHASP